MSQADVELVCRSFDLWNRGDLTEWIAVHHPDVVVVPPDGWPEGAQTLFSRDEWLARKAVGSLGAKAATSLW